MSYWQIGVQGFLGIFFEERCLSCGEKGERLCSGCLAGLEMDESIGRSVYLFKPSQVARKLVESGSNKELAAYLTIRLITLGWESKKVIGRGDLVVIARLLERRLKPQSSDCIAIGRVRGDIILERL